MMMMHSSSMLFGCRCRSSSFVMVVIVDVIPGITSSLNVLMLMLSWRISWLSVVVNHLKLHFITTCIFYSLCTTKDLFFALHLSKALMVDDYSRIERILDVWSKLQLIKLLRGQFQNRVDLWLLIPLWTLALRLQSLGASTFSQKDTVTLGIIVLSDSISSCHIDDVYSCQTDIVWLWNL